MLPTPRFQQSQDRVLTDTQRALAQLADALNAIPLLDGALLDTVTLTAATALDVVHRLGRAYRGWLIVDLFYPGAQAPVFAQPSPDASTTLRLYCAEACRVRVWVF